MRGSDNKQQGKSPQAQPVGVRCFRAGPFPENNDPYAEEQREQRHHFLLDEQL